MYFSDFPKSLNSTGGNTFFSEVLLGSRIKVFQDSPLNVLGLCFRGSTPPKTSNLKPGELFFGLISPSKQASRQGGLDRPDQDHLGGLDKAYKRPLKTSSKAF